LSNGRSTVSTPGFDYRGASVLHVVSRKMPGADCVAVRRDRDIVLFVTERLISARTARLITEVLNRILADG
jgi:hypothetical protein